MDIIQEIKKLKKQKNAIILGHFYQLPEIQDISDFIGDSLALAQQAEKTEADLIIFAGVSFMAETAKLINPTKKVILPDLNAGCSLADSCPAEDFKNFKVKYPDHLVVSYINTTNAIKALSDIICTSSNALAIINSFPKEQKLIFAPDKNLGNYLNKMTGRNMVVWPGACHVHKRFSLERILQIKEENKEAKIIAHPECEPEVLIVADFIGSTTSLLNFTKKDNSNIFIVATETGILHQMRKSNPGKTFIAAPPDDATCACNDCFFMKLITLEKIYKSLVTENPEITLDIETADKALIPIRRMLDLSEKLGL
ncbi:MAG TPA: quinolinate synthase [Marinilabiliales bacterium]|jgi:quinolinate synthase|nr:MAG: quinolinate synthase [Bacteroidetes bacterium GWA2_40_14]OFX57488.1 MAG: quinolinate synthase [Bacteroidetes bacterium GWC2_40_13]OFX71712.1 MAG: quinolinate synthase [Bacteroidetes bacterium GWD2_40_43]OFX90251.1 MAG: quinolinate synthase [Bacteroidetes bacterium GWE2_40_63]OFY22089.1 MAG: quinolinate synthase [Bacteroidetes bacterium GWF2_40_13]OFZ27714.1 MAG: quinolinate synthase [Bacteroidetes bacterium RIFOXYC2_FULL_40_12]HAM99746.1 quinolinate synthase [Marinilabiliales bacteriu